MHVVETPFSRLTLCDDGVLEAHPIDRSAPRSAALLNETIDALVVVGRGLPRPVLWDPTGTLPLPPDGWMTIVDMLEGTMSALAIVLPDHELPLLGPFPETIASLLIPVQTFNDAAAARVWLRGFVDED